MSQSPRTKRRSASASTLSPEGRWQGALQGQFRNLLYGWCIDTEQPQARVVLEVCLNGETVGCVIADVARSDLAEEFARVLLGRAATDHCHGFVADLGVQAALQEGSFTVRVANTDAVLPGHAAAQVADKPPVSATSQVFSDGGLRLLGWAMDARQEARPLSIRAFVDDKLVAHTQANQVHPALGSYHVGSHGFTLDLPLVMADGRQHTVRVVDDNGTPLNGSPVTVCCYPGGAKALLPQQVNGPLTDVIDNYERYIPRSLGLQQYPQWSAAFETVQELEPPAASSLQVGIIVTGDSGADASARTLSSLEQQPGVTVQVFAPQGKGKAKRPFATLLQLALQSGCDLVGCVRAGDTLPSHALRCALEGFASADAQLVYTDSEYLGQPWFKPAWNPEYALGSDYPLELMLVRSSLVQQLIAQGALLPDSAGFAWSALGALWPTADISIVHVPRVLYQFHSSLSTAEQQARTHAAQHTLQAAEPAACLAAADPEQTAHTPSALFEPRRLQRTLSKREQKKGVSLIIPTRDRVELLERCITTLQQYTPWADLEIMVVDNDSVQALTKTYFRKIAKQGVTILPVPGAFNFATLNNVAVNAARGEIVGLINNDIEALHTGWLEEMVSHLLSPGVGAVGAKLLWPNGMVQHGGVLLGVGNVAGHYGNRLADADWGDHGRNQLVQQVSAVTAACLFLRKADYLAVGGMDPVAFPVAFNDVDLCLKLRAQGKTIVWTPHARLLHAESASRGHEDTPQKRARAQRELEHLRQRWGHVLLHDPAYHPSLNLDPHSHAFGGLALPPRNRAPRLAGLNPQAK